jgi:creatinine amidohydrolase/Fe(II)-dependent formamide hydrolase-like protein
MHRQHDDDDGIVGNASSRTKNAGMRCLDAAVQALLNQTALQDPFARSNSLAGGIDPRRRRVRVAQ